MRVGNIVLDDQETGSFFRVQPENAEPPIHPKQDAMTTQEEYRARAYDNHHKVAEEYDEMFRKQHDEDLNMTLIFVSPRRSFVEHLLTRASGRT